MGIDKSTLKAGGFMPQIQKDHYSMRLKVVGGNISVSQLLQIAKIARKYGQDYVHLTSRQGVEIPFVKYEEIEAVKDELAKGKLELGAAGARVRSITACQGGKCCPQGVIDAGAVARKLDARYFGRQLPHKFKIGVTGCPNNCLKAEENDLGVKGGVEKSWVKENCVFCGACQRVCKRKAIIIEKGTATFFDDKCNHCGKCVKACPKNAMQGVNGFILSFGGTFGNEIVKGRNLLPLITDEESLFRVCDATLDFFEKRARKGERLALLLKRVGVAPLRRVLEKALVSTGE
ncbi:MAG: 4Fe-4S binding protein [Thermoguttaceae bacterium]|nr:4Fe-4S binding protein [Thermoguttaceae bacterium]